MNSEHILQFFAYQHLPAHLQAVSKPFGEMAEKIVAELPRNPRAHRRASQTAGSEGRRCACAARERCVIPLTIRSRSTCRRACGSIGDADARVQALIARTAEQRALPQRKAAS